MELLGVRVDAMTMDDLHALIARAVTEQRRWIVANHNTHSIYLHQRDAKMRAFYAQARCAHLDGMPLVLLGRLRGLPLRPEHRTTYADWVRPLLRFAARRRFRVFYLGSRPGVAERGAAILRAEIPGLEIATHHGYVPPAPDHPENRRVLAEIARYDPDILMVGMGMPRQEHWILDNLDQIRAHVILPAGACMDYVAGAVRTPPRWMGRFGLEWLHRLAVEPRRMWRRYLLEPWLVLAFALRRGSAQIREQPAARDVRKEG